MTPIHYGHNPHDDEGVVNVFERTTSVVTHRKVHIEHRIPRKLGFKPGVLGVREFVVYKLILLLCY
jgi:hypothetical protein